MGPTQLRSILVAAVAMTSVVSSRALAQDAGEPPPDDAAAASEPAPPVKDPKVVKTWQSAGDTLVKKGDALTKQGKTDEAKTSYENAVTAYAKAIDAAVDASALQLSMALAQDKAGDTPGALKTLKALLAVQGLKADLAKKAQARQDEMSMKVGTVALAITPEGTTVSVGGKQVGEAPLPEPLVLPPGTHVVSLAAVGYQPKDVELKIEAGSESERKIDLEPVPVIVKPAEPLDEVAPPKAPSGPSKLPL